MFMLEWESVKESVMAAMSAGEPAQSETTPAESTPAQVVENVSSQEVKTDEASNVSPVVEKVSEQWGWSDRNDTQKDAREEQINNLNKALSIERDEIKRLQAEISNYKPTFDKLKSAFVQDDVQQAVEETQAFVPDEQKFEEWYAQKEAAKAEEQSQQKLQEMIKNQITTLANEWNWEGGKPKYDDNEVYRWQRDNWKEYLTPEEAFIIMKRNDIIDWQARQVTAKAPTDISSERPAGTSIEHAPSRTTPKTDQELKNAVLEAMSAME